MNKLVTRGALIVTYLAPYVGDYHAARFCNFSRRLEEVGGLLVIGQTRLTSTDYTHRQTRRDKLLEGLDVHTLETKNDFARIRKTFQFLCRINPDVVVSLGYSSYLAFVCLIYATLFRRRIIFLSDSKADDQPRTRLGEAIKSILLSFYDGALVAGERHAYYFRSLGCRFPIRTGYDVVDNDYFSTRAAKYLRKTQRMACNSLPYVLCVSRLIPRKRVDFAINVFLTSGIWKSGHLLIVIGSGPEKDQLIKHVQKVGLERNVLFFANITNSTMPFYYSRAKALILASEYDQWGLCVNEAMACGVPALVTSRCGVAGEIVHDGVTGAIFENNNLDKAANALSRLVNDTNYWDMQSNASRTEIKKWSLDRFSDGLMDIVMLGRNTHQQ